MGGSLSRSLKTTGSDMEQSATYDFLLVIHSNYGPILYHFQDNNLGRKFQKFPNPRATYNPKFCNGRTAQKTLKSLTIYGFI